MIYLVSAEQQLFKSDKYQRLSVEDSIKLIRSWKHIQYDSETKGRDAHIGKLLSMQFGSPDKSAQIVVDATTINPVLYKDVLEEKLLIGHNLKFDLQWLYNYGIVPLHCYDTMIAEQVIHLGFPPAGKPGGISYALNEVAFRYLGIFIDKSIRGQIIYRGLDDDVIEYAAGDVVHLTDIAIKQYNKAKASNQHRAIQIECNFVPVIAYLEWCGIKLDVDKWKNKMQADESNKIEALNKLKNFVLDYYNKNNGKDGYIEKAYCIDATYDELWYNKIPNSEPCSKPFMKEILLPNGRKVSFLHQNYKIPFFIRNTAKKIVPFIESRRQLDLFEEVNTKPQCVLNFDSSEQVIYLCKLLGFNTTTEDKDTGEEKDSALEKVLAKQKGICDEFLALMYGTKIEGKHIWGYKEASKVCSTYGQTYLNAINPYTERIHTAFKQLGASSGRMSCGNKQENSDLKELIKDKLKYITNPKLRKVGYPQIVGCNNML